MLSQEMHNNSLDCAKRVLTSDKAKNSSKSDPGFESRFHD